MSFRKGQADGFSRLATLGFVCVLTLVSTLWGSASPTQAYETLGCKWGVKTIYLGSQAPLLSFEVWGGAANSWNGLDAKHVRTTSNTYQVFGTNENRGNTVSWSGITRKTGTVQDPPQCSNGRWVSGQMTVVLNWSIVGSYSDAKKNGVAAHELGHSFGIAHTNASKAILMWPYDDRTVTRPVSDDKAAVNALY